MTILPEESSAGFLPFGHLALLSNTVMISSFGIAPGREHHDPKTEAARTDSSEREWRILETVKPPWEKARSTSVDVATK
jgi:hypothetical protein